MSSPGFGVATLRRPLRSSLAGMGSMAPSFAYGLKADQSAGRGTGTLGAVKTVILDPPPPEVEALIERRRSLGIDLYDEMWKGSHHVVPAPNAQHAYVGHRLAVLLEPFAQAAGLVGTDPFNLGEPDDYRVPDRGYHRGAPSGVWVTTAAIVVEVVSPGDETYEKFGFYARHDVEELIIADPAEHKVAIWRRASEERYELTPASTLLGVSADHLTAAVDWPGPAIDDSGSDA